MSVADGNTPSPPPQRTSQRSFTFRLFLISFLHTGDLCFKFTTFRDCRCGRISTYRRVGAVHAALRRTQRGLWEIADVDVGSGKG